MKTDFEPFQYFGVSETVLTMTMQAEFIFRYRHDLQEFSVFELSNIARIFPFFMRDRTECA